MSIGVMLFNPFTGTPRNPDDIKSDPDGFLLWDGEARLKAASSKQQEPPCSTCTNFKQGSNPLVGVYDAYCFECKHYYASKWEARP